MHPGNCDKQTSQTHLSVGVLQLLKQAEEQMKELQGVAQKNEECMQGEVVSLTSQLEGSQQAKLDLQVVLDGCREQKTKVQSKCCTMLHSVLSCLADCPAFAQHITHADGITATAAAVTVTDCDPCSRSRILNVTLARTVADWRRMLSELLEHLVDGFL